MQELFRDSPQYAGLVMVFMWISITTILGLVSGWFSNMREFPNRPAASLLSLHSQSATMGMGVALNRVFRIDVCEEGLRFGIFRFFGPFCRDFFVPWQAIEVTRNQSKFFPAMTLKFGKSGRIKIKSWVGERIALIAKDRWPEEHLPPAMSRQDIKRQYLLRWIVLSVLAGSFITAVPRMGNHDPSKWPPLFLGIIPAVIIGIAMGSAFKDTKR